MMLEREPRFFFVGQYVCLDFINTEALDHGASVDLLRNFGHFVAWLCQAGILDRGQKRDVLEKWNGKPEGDRLFVEALAWRKELRTAVERLVTGKGAGRSFLNRLNDLLRERIGYSQVRRVHAGFEKRLCGEFREARHILVPVAESASDLLCHGDLSRLKRCENPACVLYFYDTTRNHARRWCSMRVCGNRLKVAAFQQRQKQVAPE